MKPPLTGKTHSSAGLTERVTEAAAAVKVQPLAVLHHGEQLNFLGAEPRFTYKKKSKLAPNLLFSVHVTAEESVLAVPFARLPEP
jgi:hypothetical protein